MTAQPSLRCTQCQGVLLYSPSQGALRCTHCRALQQPQKSVLRVEERDLQAALKARPGSDAGPSLADLPGSRVARCRECGAQVVLAGGLVASACAFCRSPTVLAQAQQHSSLRPDSLIPFQIARGRAQQIIHRWVRGRRWTRPDSRAGSAGRQLPDGRAGSLCAGVSGRLSRRREQPRPGDGLAARRVLHPLLPGTALPERCRRR